MLFPYISPICKNDCPLKNKHYCNILLSCSFSFVTNGKIFYHGIVIYMPHENLFNKCVKIVDLPT